MSLNHTSIYAELTEEHFQSIGKIVVEWSNIEFLLGILLTRLLVTPDFVGRSYTDHMSAFKVQEAIKEGVEIHKGRYNFNLISKSSLKEITAINERITLLRGARNKFAHFCWSRNTDEEIFGTNFSGGLPNSNKHKKSFVTFSTAELDEFYKEAYGIVEELSSIIDSLPEISEEGLSKKTCDT